MTSNNHFEGFIKLKLQNTREDALTTTTTFLDYNKKSQNDFNKIVETVEKSEGVLYEDFVKSLEQ